MSPKPKGWTYHPIEHGLASKGIKSAQDKYLASPAGKKAELLKEAKYYRHAAIEAQAEREVVAEATKKETNRRLALVGIDQYKRPYPPGTVEKIVAIEGEAEEEIKKKSGIDIWQAFQNEERYKQKFIDLALEFDARYEVKNKEQEDMVNELKNLPPHRRIVFRDKLFNIVARQNVFM